MKQRQTITTFYTIYTVQHGFREGRSCETQLVELVHDLADNMLGGGQTDVLVMDFSKAFNKVGHQRLLLKLDHYGVKKENESLDRSLSFKSNPASCYKRYTCQVRSPSRLSPRAMSSYCT